MGNSRKGVATVKVNLIGVQNFDNLKMRDGTIIDGVKLHIAYPKDGVAGNFVDSKFIGRNVFNGFGIDYKSLETTANNGVEVIDVEFDGNKKIVGIEL